MKPPLPHVIAAGLLSGLVVAACSSATRSPVLGVQPRPGDHAILTPAAQARADSGRPPYTAADVHFMSGMIAHHAQAVLMAGWAPTHGASPAVRARCKRIVVAQRGEIARGLAIFEQLPSGFLSQNEVDAAKTVRFDYLNAQEQPRLVWPPSFALARAYLDQLERSSGLAPERVSAVRNELARAEKLSGQGRRDALTRLAAELSGNAQAAGDQAKVAMLAEAVRDLAHQAH